MKRLRNVVILLMVILTCSTVVAEIKSYLTFFNNSELLTNAGVSWEKIWGDSLFVGILIYAVGMLLLILALVGLSVLGKKRAEKLEAKEKEKEAKEAEKID